MIKDIAATERFLRQLQPVMPQSVLKWLDETTSIKKDKSIFAKNKLTVEIQPLNPNDKKLPGCLKKTIYQYLIDREQTCSVSANS